MQLTQLEVALQKHGHYSLALQTPVFAVPLPHAVRFDDPFQPGGQRPELAVFGDDDEVSFRNGRAEIIQDVRIQTFGRLNAWA